MSIASIPMMTSSDPMGTMLLRDRLAERERYENIPVTAHVFVRDAHLSMEATPGALMARPVLYMHGTITSVDSESFPEQVRRGVFVDEGSLSRGCEAFVRYEFSDLQVMRLLLRGVGRKDWSGLDPQMVSNDHVLPFRADLTVIHKPNAKLPFIVCDIRDPMSLTVNRDTCGYDYVDYGGVSPSLTNEIGVENVRTLDASLKQLDAPIVAPEREDAMSYYEDRLFESVFSDADRAREADEDLANGRAHERHLTQEGPAAQEIAEVPKVAEASRTYDQTRPGGIGASVVSELIAERARARDARTARLAAEERERRAEAEAKTQASSSSLFDDLLADMDDVTLVEPESLFDGLDDEDEGHGTTTSRRAVQAATIEAVEHDVSVSSALSDLVEPALDETTDAHEADDYEFGL